MIADVQLPGEDDFAAIGTVQKSKSEGGSNVPILAISTGDHADQSRVLGADAYLQKPITPEGLFVALDQMM